MLTETERKNLISHIETFPDRLEKVVRGLSEEQLNRRYRSDSWTVRQVVHHLADSHVSGYVRMKLVVTEDDPILKSYDQVAWAGIADVANVPIDSSLQILRGLHTRWAAFLRSVDPENWSRKGLHTENGVMNLEDLLIDYGKHGDMHLSHIQAALK